MKSLFRIIRRYSLTAGGIMLVILCCNFLVLGYFMFDTVRESNTAGTTRSGMVLREWMDAVGKQLIREEGGGGYTLSEEGNALLDDCEFIWAMALSGEGEIVWERDLPEALKKQYSLIDVASFSRWYLDDYPVRVWSAEELLLVFGAPEGSSSKFSLEYPTSFIQNIFVYIRILICVNLLVVALFALCYGFRFYRSLQPVAAGIEKLSAGEPVCLREKGVAGELAEKLNQTSRILEQQQKKLRQRDRARTEWISGVSHDIRTPLALIIGYADRISEGGAKGLTSEKADSLPGEQRELSTAIRRQCLVIRQLIEDLNLTSKLAYSAQPLRKKRIHPAGLLRECVADLYNEGLDQEYEIEIRIPRTAEQAVIMADEGLLKRALRNLIGNSIRHNGKGVRVMISLYTEGVQVRYRVADTGPGIPEEIAEALKRWDTEEGRNMGLRLTSQIARAHGGELVLLLRKEGGYDAELRVSGE
ncbi:MAG: HAMP domain-containing sensor histidine kinase [Eubacteriales bacterium]|nr:HAMP domain-containing sensor histidine kinase [Eubacteriales bacterium]